MYKNKENLYVCMFKFVKTEFHSFVIAMNKDLIVHYNYIVKFTDNSVIYKCSHEV